MTVDKANQVGGNPFENDYNYTTVRVKDKDSGKTFTIDMVNSQVEGNSAKWKIENGKVYIYDATSKKYKPVNDNTLEVTRYQAAILKAAAEAGDQGGTHKLNIYDICGAAFGERVDKELGRANSEYKVKRHPDVDRSDPYSYDADALEYGVFYANVTNGKDNGRLKITINTEPDKYPEQYTPPKENKPWWKFW